MTKDEALKLALEALKANQPVNYCMNNNGEKFPMMQEDPLKFDRNSKVIAAIKEALAQPEQEPVAKTVWVVGGKTWQQICATKEDVHKLIADMGMNTPSLCPSMSEVPVLSYTTPPQRKPLTDDRIDEAIQQHVDPAATYRKLHDFARAIEAAHGIKEIT